MCALLAQLAHQVLNLAMIVCSALMIWKGLMVVTESESPVVVVLRFAPSSSHHLVERCHDSPPPCARPRSGSMEPAFYRGDILFLHMGFTPFRAGDIVVFKVADREIPIVHRVIKARASPAPPRGGVSPRESAPAWCHVAQVHEKESGEVDILTKGDNNAVDDRGLYAASQSWINKEHVIGRAKGYLPYIGMVTIIMNDYPVRRLCLRPARRAS